MEPLTTAALIMGGASVLGAAGRGVGNYMALAPNEAVQKRISELERLQQADALGLTGTERSAFMESFVDPQRALAAEQMAQSQALTGMAQDSGEQLRRMRAQDEAAQRTLAESNRQIAMLDMQQARAQEAELLQLQQAEEEREKARRVALIGGATETAVAGMQMASQQIAASELTKMSPEAANMMNVQRIAGGYGYNFPTYSPMPTGYPYNPYAGMGMGGMLPPQPYGYYPGLQQPTIPTAAPAGQVGTGEQ